MANGAPIGWAKTIMEKLEKEKKELELEKQRSLAIL